MAMQASDPSVRSSSIVLLQERFRQLQRAKEIREERELFKLLSEAVKLNPPMCYYYEPFYHGELFKEAPMATIKLQPPTVLQMDTDIKEKPYLANDLLSKDMVMHRQIVFDDEHSDVDTSLHL